MADSDQNVVVKSERFATQVKANENPLVITENNIDDGPIAQIPAPTLQYPVEDQDRYHAFVKFEPIVVVPPQITGLNLDQLLKSALTFRSSDGQQTEQQELQEQAKSSNTKVASEDSSGNTGSGSGYVEPAERKNGNNNVKLSLPKSQDSSTAANLDDVPNKVPSAQGTTGGTETTLSSKEIDPTGEFIKIFMPVSFTSSDTFQYENPSLGLTGAIAENAMNAGSQQVSSAIFESMSKGVEGIQELLGLSGDGAKAGAARVISKSTLARAAKGRGFEGLRNAVGTSARVTVNPNIRTVFRGVAIRTFTFDFKFISKSQAEALVVDQIITRFRKHAYPETDTMQILDQQIDAVYNFPNLFQIDVNYKTASGSTVRIGPKLKMCYLTSIRTVYNATSMSFHPDGRPTEVDLSLTFMEEIPLDKQDIRDGF
jgi:hypothetical protein